MKLVLREVRCLPGFAGGLAERTALVDVAVEAAPDRDAGAEDRLRAGAVSFCPDEHLYDVGESDWPAAFLVPAPDGGDGPTRWLGEWVVALAVALQRWGHDPVYRGRVLVAEPDRLRVALPWHREQPLRDAVEEALQLVCAWVRPEPDRAALRRIDRRFRGRLEAVQAGGMHVDALRFAESAARSGLPYEVGGGVVRIGWGANAEYLDGTATGDTGVLAAALARNKALANRRLAAAGVPVPRCQVATGPEQARQAAADLGWPVVVKPLGLDSGIGVEPGIRDWTTLDKACAQAANLGRGPVLVEKHHDGLCYRLLVVHGEMLAAVRRVPAGVVGDGVRTVSELIEAANTEPRRGTVIGRLFLEGPALRYLSEQGYSPGSVPAAGARAWLRRTAYSETGGHHEDVTDVVHPDNRALAQRVARLVRLDIAGIDLLSTDITRSWREVGAAVCEVNAQPSLMPHWVAQPDRDINAEVLTILFGGRPARIPTAAVTGSGPTAAAAAMLHRIWTAEGRPAGVCTSGELRIGTEVIDRGDHAGLAGARTVLAEPGVRAAVLELAGARLADTGHPCDRYDVVAVLGGADADGCADTVERASGAVVIDAADPSAPALLARAGAARHILVGADPAAVAGHRAGGGEAVAVEMRDGRPWLVLAAGDRQTAVLPVADIAGDVPAALFAAAMAWVHGIDASVIGTGLAAPDVAACRMTAPGF